MAARLGRRFIACDVVWRAVHTTRARLVEETKEPFSLLKVAGEKVEGSNTLHASHLTLHSSTVSIDLNSVPELDYWEVDPAWDGRIFRSAAQAVRPRRKGTIPATLSLPVRQAESSLCLRLVSATGEQYQVNL